MADQNKEAMGEIIKGMSYLVDKKFNDSATLIYTGIITQVSEIDSVHYYSVKINGNTYQNVQSITTALSVNQIVKVVIPQGQYNQMFILGYFQ